MAILASRPTITITTNNSTNVKPRPAGCLRRPNWISPSLYPELRLARDVILAQRVGMYWHISCQVNSGVSTLSDSDRVLTLAAFRA